MENAGTLNGVERFIASRIATDRWCPEVYEGMWLLPTVSTETINFNDVSEAH